MKIYSVFDDYNKEAIDIIRGAGGELTIHPTGISRPNTSQMKVILKEYDCIIIGTGQRITEDMFEGIETPRIIATASVGLDHITKQKKKRSLVTIINTPKANAQSVAEYTIGCALVCCKRLIESKDLYQQGKSNKFLYQKPEDLIGKTIGVIGAGNISQRIMEYASIFGMHTLCWTRNPNKHRDLEQHGVRFVDLNDLVRTADYISVNLPNKLETKGMITSELISEMKSNAVFISVSRLDVIDVEALFDRARMNKAFYVCLDLDVDSEIVRQMPKQPNILVTPHIAGGTVETRKRMFTELANTIAYMISEG